jgi:hypothetical protein
MPLHHGHIIERIVRKNGHSISDVARLVKVNRRSIYNWFNLATLNSDIIYQIGHAIKHDFSVEFPDFFKPKDFIFQNKASFSAEDLDRQLEAEKELLWKERYLELLERYTKLIEERLSVFPI